MDVSSRRPHDLPSPGGQSGPDFSFLYEWDDNSPPRGIVLNGPVPRVERVEVHRFICRGRFPNRTLFTSTKMPIAITVGGRIVLFEDDGDEVFPTIDERHRTGNGAMTVIRRTWLVLFYFEITELSLSLLSVLLIVLVSVGRPAHVFFQWRSHTTPASARKPTTCFVLAFRSMQFAKQDGRCL